MTAKVNAFLKISAATAFHGQEIDKERKHVKGGKKARKNVYDIM